MKYQTPFRWLFLILGVWAAIHYHAELLAILHATGRQLQSFGREWH